MSHFHLECPFKSAEALASGDWDDIPRVFLKETETGAEPLQATWFKTAWNERELRVFFHCDDTNAWATHTVRDAPLYNEEVVEIFFDPEGDLQSYFEIEVNPLNTVCDLVLRRAGSGWRKDFGWDCEGLQTVTNRQSAWWTVEMIIPFAALGAAAQPAVGKTWRVNFFRIDRPEDLPADVSAEFSAWSPTGRRLFHVQEKFGVLEFVRQSRAIASANP